MNAVPTPPRVTPTVTRQDLDPELVAAFLKDQYDRYSHGWDNLNAEVRRGLTAFFTSAMRERGTSLVLTERSGKEHRATLSDLEQFARTHQKAAS